MLSADEIINLKARITSELTRRNVDGSLNSYISSDYNFTNTPDTDQPLYQEQGKKIIEQVTVIKDVGDLHFRDIDDYTPIPESFNYDDLNSAISSMEKETESSTTCRGACTGMCAGSCSSSCSG